MAACAAPGDDPEFPPSATLTLEGFIGGVWVEIYTTSLSIPTDPSSLGDSYTLNVSGSTTFAAALTCDLRLRLSHRRNAWTPGNTGCRLSAYVALTDWRLTTTDTAAACSTSTSSIAGGGGGGGSDCGCEDTTRFEMCVDDTGVRKPLAEFSGSRRVC